eukprot:1619112-Rhodomonas_salina.1
MVGARRKNQLKLPVRCRDPSSDLDLERVGNGLGHFHRRLSLKPQFESLEAPVSGVAVSGNWGSSVPDHEATPSPPRSTEL